MARGAIFGSKNTEITEYANAVVARVEDPEVKEKVRHALF